MTATIRERSLKNKGVYQIRSGRSRAEPAEAGVPGPRRQLSPAFPPLSSPSRWRTIWRARSRAAESSFSVDEGYAKLDGMLADGTV
jgi:hypothetical protein